MKRKQLSQAEWMAIRTQCEAGVKISEIARAYGIGKSAIYKRRKGWTAETEIEATGPQSGSEPDHSVYGQASVSRHGTTNSPSRREAQEWRCSVR